VVLAFVFQVHKCLCVLLPTGTEELRGVVYCVWLRGLGHCSGYVVLILLRIYVELGVIWHYICHVRVYCMVFNTLATLRFTYSSESMLYYTEFVIVGFTNV